MKTTHDCGLSLIVNRNLRRGVEMRFSGGCQELRHTSAIYASVCLGAKTISAVENILFAIPGFKLQIP